MVFLLMTPPVIASPPIIDHASDETASRANWLVLIIGLMAIGGFLIFLYAQPKWLIRRGHPQPASPPRMFSILAWQWLVAPVLALIGASIFKPQLDPSDWTLREWAQQTVIAQAAMLPLVFLWFWLGRTKGERTWVSHAITRIESSGGSVPRGRLSPLRAAGVGVLGLLIAWPIVMFTGEISSLVHESLTGQPSPVVAHKTLEQLAAADASDPWLRVMILAVVLVAPFLEEVVYRGAIQGCLRGLVRSPWPAIILSALMFGMMHVGTAASVAIPGLVVFGAALGIIYERSGSLLAPIVTHALFNLGNIGLLLLLRPNVG